MISRIAFGSAHAFLQGKELSNRMISIANELSLVEPGKLSHAGNLTVLPLFRRSVAAESAPYLLLDEAIASGVVRITELPGGGSVPELLLENRATRPVLLVDGEE